MGFKIEYMDKKIEVNKEEKYVFETEIASKKKQKEWRNWPRRENHERRWRFRLNEKKSKNTNK